MKNQRFSKRNIVILPLLTSVGTLVGTAITLPLDDIFGWGIPRSQHFGIWGGISGLIPCLFFPPIRLSSVQKAVRRVATAACNMETEKGDRA